MKCTCPKCHAKIELDLPEVTDAGISATCPACNARFTVHRECFGGRALRKSSEISCAPCGSELGAEMHCATCGTRFPDYLVVSLGRKKVRQTNKKAKANSAPLAARATDKNAGQLPTLEMAMKLDAAPSPPTKTYLPSSGGKFSRSLAVTVSVVVITALIATGAIFYLKSKAEKAYAKSFVLATYCIQTSTDKSLKASAKIAAEWKAKTDAGLTYRPRASMEDETDLGIINNKLAEVLPKLAKAPEKFKPCNEKLEIINAAHRKLQTLVLAPGNSRQSFVENSNKLSGDYRQAVQQFKSGLPKEIMDELVSASNKFKSLKPLVN